MSSGERAGTDDRASVGQSTLAMVGALHAELADALRVVSRYGDGDRSVLYASGEADAPDRRLAETIDQRSFAEGTLEYAIDAYEEVVVVVLSPHTVSSLASSGSTPGIAFAVERHVSLREITAATERAVAASRQ